MLVSPSFLLVFPLKEKQTALVTHRSFLSFSLMSRFSVSERDGDGHGPGERRER